MVLSNQKPQIQFLDLLTGSTSLSTKIQSISLVHQTQLTIANLQLALLHHTTINQMLLVLTHKVTTLHALLLKPTAVTPQVPQSHAVVKIILVILLLAQQLVWTTTIIQHLVQVHVGIM